MKSVVLAVIVAVGALVPSAEPTTAETPMPGLARFEGRIIDLAEDWDDAQACVVWDQEHLAECFRSEAELIEHLSSSTEGGDGQTLGVLSTCASSLKLYDGLGFSGSALYLHQRTTWINLSDYGWANRTSSYKVGACSSYFADLANGGGDWYPTSYTQAYDQATSMISGWNNRISSVYLS